jgi:Baseplate J-like protein
MPSPPPPYTFYQKTPKQVHDDYIRTLRNGLIQIGIANPNVGQQSDYDKQATALGNEIAVGQANCVIMADQVMPDTAAGPIYLDRWLKLFGLTRNPATPSHGNITITLSTASTLIPTNAQLTDVAGLRYQVSVGGTYANQTQVPIVAVDLGTATNHNNGDVLTWVTPPPFAAPTVVVGTPGATDGLIDGANSEVGLDEPPRNRLFNVIQNPPMGGNWSQVSKWGAAAAPGQVGLCAVYPALLGPATVFVCVRANVNLTPPFSNLSFTSAVPSALVSSTIVPYIQSQLPEHAYCQGLSSVDYACDVALMLALPSATTALPPGPGGGWLDGAPWPPSNVTDGARITSVTSSTVITINATTTNPPAIGGTHISWVSPNNWTIYSATVLGYTGGTGAWVLTLDTPLPNVIPSGFIFPSSLNQNVYLLALLGAFAKMGPGEWTNLPSILTRGFRHPIPGLTAPYSMNNAQLSTVIRSSPEVQDAQYIYRSVVSPPIPALPVGTNAPYCLTPQSIGFYQQ